MHNRLSTSLFRVLASLPLAVGLLVLVAFILACATILETRFGAAYSQWYVYDARWFVGLLALLGVNIFCAAAIRFPWKRYQTGFVITHAGLLVLLAGSIMTFLHGVEGRVSLTEGESTDSLQVADRSQLSAFWVGRPQEPPYEFTFNAGPVEWSENRSLQLGEVDGVRARIVRYFHQARPVETWIADETKFGGPAVKFKVTGKDGVTVAESWLVDHQYGDAVHLGPLRLQLERAVTDGMLKDFLEPQLESLGKQGLLVMYYNGAMQQVSLDQAVGKKVTLPGTDATVEIVEYFPNAIPDKLGNFTSKNEQPKNPMVELRVHLAGEEKPLRQIAFARDPLLNLDGVYSRVCPVKFRFHHSAIRPKSGLELMQTSDGKLFGRICTDGTYESQGEIRAGHRIATGSDFALQVVEHLPHAVQNVTFAADSAIAGQAKQRREPASLVEISVGGITQQIWLRRNDVNFGQRILTTRNGALALKFENANIPLGFTLKLDDFRRESNPGNAGNASFSSRVRVVDPASRQHFEHTISMNEPLTQGKFTFYQSSFDDAIQNRETSVFSVAYDPGRILKYAGSLMISLGIAIMFYMRAYFFKNTMTVAESASSDPEDVSPDAMSRVIDLDSAA